MTDTPTGIDEQPEPDQTASRVLGEQLERIKELTDQFTPGYLEVRLREILDRVDAGDEDQAVAPLPCRLDIQGPYFHAGQHITGVPARIEFVPGPAH
ncbi:hypothetical protein [Actinomadura chibensis]|uniref:Uncharacterized protein n=1 Tax=Actinomadura chibensis TaxID=392828 RepID=A0A5D0NPB4_9ACTN|nr:hypothetical protein [Actinomadura chibensis]TYB46366.1 hypothetical protein FXF69_13955 [Actinomadura chibensis]